MAKNDPIDASAPPEGGKKPAGRPTKKKAFKKRGEKRIVHHGYAHIQASFNNTIITITDPEGAVVAWSSAGGIGFKGSRKGTPFAATQAAIAAGNTAKAMGLRSVEVRVKGPGAGASRRFARCRRSASTSSRSATSRRSRTTAAGRRRGEGL
jgi:small subunit ribosomal protein S11